MRSTRVLELMASQYLDKVGTVALALGLCPHHWAGSYSVVA